MLSFDLRPESIDEVIGQNHIRKTLTSIIESKNIPNLIFFGPPGVGKTTVAEILSKNTNKTFKKINATTSSLDDLRKVLKLSEDENILLYIDEIQNFNKKQQQALLDFIENGKVTLIASTTENPYHYIYKAIVSRSIVLEFKPVDLKDIKKYLQKIATDITDKDIDEDVFRIISESTGGDVRAAINRLDLLLDIYKDSPHIGTDELTNLNLYDTHNFDTDSEVHYNLLSALQKSIRGSDVDASLYYLAKLIKGRDLNSIIRRLTVIAAEDIGLANPQAFLLTKAVCDSVEKIGLPEARIPLSMAVIYLATSPKSNSAYISINKALKAAEITYERDIPDNLKDAHYDGAENLNHGSNYLYPHDYENHYIKQNYMPAGLETMKLYNPCKNMLEAQMYEYLCKLKGEK